MLRPCFNIFTEESDSSSDEAEWDEALRTDGPLGEGATSRAICMDCGKPLRRIARLPGYSALLKCGSVKECERCEEQILPGELHFCCSNCRTQVCKSCGPGVYIARHYDYYDAATGEGHMEEIPAKALHERKARRKMADKIQSGQQRRRSIMIDGSLNAQEIARKVVAYADCLSEEVAGEKELLDQEWIDSTLLPKILGAAGWSDVAQRLQCLAQGARDVMIQQPVLSEVRELPCKIFGDIHGQLRDMLLLFHAFGMPGTPECPSAVFNGDFVDRGKHQLEVVAILFSLKILYPTQVYLNRGNHEDHHMNQRYGFMKACESLGPQDGHHTYKAIEETFQHLPLAALVGGRILALHGGIGDGKWSIQDLNQVRRPLTHDELQKPESNWLWNILWSDPIEDDQLGTSVFGVHSSPRSRLAVKFGWNVTQAFCATNGLDLVVRSHQSKKDGLGFDVMHHESLIRVFSARDYEKNGNDGAVLLVERPEDGDESGLLSVRAQVLGSVSKDSAPELAC